jgi:hypothetical protein
MAAFPLSVAYLPRQLIGVFATFGKDAGAMVAVKNRPVGADFQRAWLTRGKRSSQVIIREPPEEIKLYPVQSVGGMQESELREVHLFWGSGGCLIVRHE